MPDVQNCDWKLGADGIEYVWTDVCYVCMLCTKLHENKTYQDEDDDEDSIEIDNLLDEMFYDQ